MKINLRILVAVMCMLLLAAAAITIVKSVGDLKSTVIIERIPPRGLPTAGRVIAGLSLQIDSQGLNIVVPDCDTMMWQDKFFVHLYTYGKRNGSPDDLVNLDFSLTDEANKISDRKAGVACRVYKSFDNFKVQAAALGQYSTLGGKCCDITWSRFYLFDSVAVTK